MKTTTVEPIKNKTKTLGKLWGITGLVCLVEYPLGCQGVGTPPESPSPSFEFEESDSEENAMVPAPQVPFLPIIPLYNGNVYDEDESIFTDFFFHDSKVVIGEEVKRPEPLYPEPLDQSKEPGTSE